MNKNSVNIKPPLKPRHHPAHRILKTFGLLACLAAAGCSSSNVELPEIVRNAVDAKASSVRRIQARLAGAAAIDEYYEIPQARLSPEGQFALVKTYFATNRGADSSDNPTETFGEDAGDATQFGHSYVAVQREYAKSLEPERIWRFDFDSPPRDAVSVRHNETVPIEDFLQDLDDQASALESNSSLLYVHGFNISFDEAAAKTAQLSYDLGFAGAPAFFSWPAKTSIEAYALDKTMMEQSTQALEQFIRAMLDSDASQAIYLVAHGLGASVSAEAVKNLVQTDASIRSRFRRIILVAPDINAQSFARDLAPSISTDRAPIIMYASQHDLALDIARSNNDYRRAGDATLGVLVTAGVESVDLGGIDSSNLYKKIRGDQHPLIADMRDAIRAESPAEFRVSLRMKTTENGVHWEFRE